MLPQKILNVVKLSRNNILLSQQCYLPLSTSALLKSTKEGDGRVKYDPKKLKEEEELYGMKLNKDKSVTTDDYVTENNVRRPFFVVDIDTFKFLHSDFEFTPDGIKKYVSNKYNDSQRDQQLVKMERVAVFGSDIAAAYFVLYEEGKIKFKHSEEWIGINKNEDDLLPNYFDSTYILTELDMNDVVLRYEGLTNFTNCPRITRASFQRSPYFDEWFADRLTHLMPNLQYLDLSDCPKFNERGLEAFYKLSNLKTLIVTNNNMSAAFELTCMMLEDIIPGLTIKILEPKKKEEGVKKNNVN